MDWDQIVNTELSINITVRGLKVDRTAGPPQYRVTGGRAVVGRTNPSSSSARGVANSKEALKYKDQTVKLKYRASKY